MEMSLIVSLAGLNRERRFQETHSLSVTEHGNLQKSPLLKILKEPVSQKTLSEIEQQLWLMPLLTQETDTSHLSIQEKHLSRQQMVKDMLYIRMEKVLLGSEPWRQTVMVIL